MATVRLQHRRDTLANWTTENPILGDGEIGYETDTGVERLGDGTTVFLSLPVRTTRVAPFDTVALLQADTTLTTSNMTVGDIVHYAGHRAEYVGTSGGDIQNSAGTPLHFDVLIGDQGALNVLAFGAVGDGVTDDTASIQAAIDASIVSGVGYITVYFPTAVYMISSPLRFNANHRIDGHESFIKAMAGFTGDTLTNVGDGGTTVVDALLIYLLGDYNDIGGAQRKNAFIGRGITLDCDDITTSGLYMERMVYATVQCKVINSKTGGAAIDIGPYCWGLHLDGPTVEAFSAIGISIGDGCNGVTITSPKIWGDTKIGTYGIYLDVSSNINGLHINGGFIEKLTHGLYVDRGNGPVVVSGVDFEVCSTNCIRIEGNVADAFKSTVTADGCYFSATGSKIYATYGIVNINGCRLRNLNDFETGTAGFISATNNQYESGLPTIVASSNVAVDIELPWTPVLWDDSLSDGEGQTYSVGVGSYNRVGNRVFFKGNIAMSSIGTLGGAEGARIGGLPFSSSSVANSHSVATVGYGSGLAIVAANALSGYIGVSQNYINIQKFSATTGTANLTVTEVSASGQLFFSGDYTV